MLGTVKPLCRWTFLCDFHIKTRARSRQRENQSEKQITSFSWNAWEMIPRVVPRKMSVCLRFIALASNVRPWLLLRFVFVFVFAFVLSVVFYFFTVIYLCFCFDLMALALTFFSTSKKFFHSETTTCFWKFNQSMEMMEWNEMRWDGELLFLGWSDVIYATWRYD